MKKRVTRLRSPAAAVLLILIMLVSPSIPSVAYPFSNPIKDKQAAIGNVEVDMYQVLVDTEEVKITALGIGSGSYRFGLFVEIENKTDEDFAVQVREFAVNGYAVTTYFSSDVPANSIVSDIISLDVEDLAMANIEEISAVQMKFIAFDWETFDDFLNCDTVYIDTGSSYQQEYIDFNGTTLYDSYGIKIVLLDIDYSNQSDPKIYMYTENHNNEAMNIGVWNLTINGKEVACYYGVEVPAGMRSIGCINRYESYLDAISSAQPVEMEFEFDIHSSDFSISIDPDPITVII